MAYKALSCKRGGMTANDAFAAAGCLEVATACVEALRVNTDEVLKDLEEYDEPRV
jgi:hypothetical protein